MPHLLRIALLGAVVLALPAAAQGLSDTPGSPSLRSDVERQPAARAHGEIAEPDLLWAWTGEPRWLAGAPFGGDAMSGGLFYGRHWFMGSSVPEAEDVPVEIHFDSGEATLARVFRQDLGYEDAGVGTFRGSAWDVSDPANPRRLNLCFVEHAGEGTPNNLWDPNGSLYGKREYLFIMASAYDGTGETYAGMNPWSGPDLDVHYVATLRVADGRTFFESDPATLALTPPPLRFIEPIPGNGTVTIHGSYLPDDGAPLPDAIQVYGDPSGAPTTLLDELPVPDGPGSFTTTLTGLDAEAVYTFRLDLVDADGGLLYSAPPFSLRPIISQNVALLGQLNPRPPVSSTYGGLWGYTAPGGAEYALVTAREYGLSVVDISGPAPVEVGFAPGISDSKEVKTYGVYAYLVNENGPVQIISLADPSNPVEVGQIFNDPVDGGAHTAQVSGEYLYLMGGNQSGNVVGGLRIYSLASPEAPSLVGEFQHFYYHDVLVRGDTLFAAGIYGDGIDILDLTDRAQPVLINTFNYPGSGPHNICSTEDGRYIFIGDEIGTGPWTRIFDVADLDDPTQVGEIIVNPDAIAHNCFVRGDRLYIAHYTEGLRVFDITDPTAPTEFGFYDTYLPPDFGYRGAWDAYPHFASGKVIVSDMQSGLFVFAVGEGVAVEPNPPEAPGALLLAAYPNPSRGAGTLRFTLGAPAEVRLALFDAVGREVALVAEGRYEAGTHAVRFNGDALPSGVYLARLGADGRSATRRITVLR